MKVTSLGRVSCVAAIGLLPLACGGPELGRIGPRVALPNGDPVTSCEREDWYEVAPTRMRAQGAVAGVGVTTYYSQIREGLGVYRPGEPDPEDLEDVFPAFHEPDLARKHQARIQPVDDANTRGTLWALGGLAGLFGGIGTAAAIQKESGTGAAIAGVSGLVLGVVGIVGALAAQPSGYDQLEADARRKLFLPKEDDLVAIERGADGANAAVRTRCGGRPVPFRPPRLPPPSPAPAGPAEEMTVPSAPPATSVQTRPAS